jgi:two-component system, response regulator PdtaR
MKTRVMVVDDSKIVTGVLSSVLTGAGYDVVAVNSPFSVMDALKRFRPQLVLMDLDIPGLNGVKIIEHITAKDYGFGYGIVVHSSADEETLRQAASLDGVLGYIKKGGPMDELIGSVKRFIDLSGLRQEEKLGPEDILRQAIL